MGEPENSLYAQDLLACPFEAYRALRDHQPVGSMPVGRYGEISLVSRYDDVWDILHDTSGYPSSGALDLTGDGNDTIPLSIDPPAHSRYRRLLDPLFSPRAMAAFEPTVRQHARKLVEAFAAKGECEYHDEFAVPYPAELFMQLVGFPMKDLDRMLEWKQVAVRVEELIAGGDEDSIARMIEKVRTSGAEAYAYFDELAEVRSREPADDLMTRMLNIEIEGERLTRPEIQAICFTVMLGGLDTVTASLTCIVAWFAQNPEYRRGVVANPATLPDFIEELMRRESPVMTIFRRSAQEVCLHGTTIPAESTVGVLLGAANNDERHYPETDVIEPARQAKRHLAFGAGPHRCLGSHLGRMELRVALEELHRLVPDYRIPDGHQLQYGGTNIRTVNPLPLVWD